MIFKKLTNVLIAGCIMFLVISCTGTKEIPSTTKENTVVKNNTNEKIMVISQIDENTSLENIDKFQKLIASDETTRYAAIKKIFEPYNTIDEALKQDSINLLTEVLLSTPKKQYQHLQAEKHRNEAPDKFDGMIEEYKKELTQEIKDYFELINFLISKGANVGYLDNEENNSLLLFQKAIDPLRKLGTGIDIIQEKDKINELIIDNATGINIIFAAQNISELESFKKAVDKAPDINLVVETEHKQKRNALHYIIINLQDQKTQKVTIHKAIYLLEKGIKVFENNWWKQNEDFGLIASVLVFAGSDFENASILCDKLIQAGADVNFTALNRSPLFEILVFVGYPNFSADGGEELIRIFVEKGADVNFVLNKKTPLDRVSSRLNSENAEIKSRASRIVELLKSKGAKTFAELEQ